jgi:hypothetical protein
VRPCLQTKKSNCIEFELGKLYFKEINGHRRKFTKIEAGKFDTGPQRDPQFTYEQLFHMDKRANFSFLSETLTPCQVHAYNPSTWRLRQEDLKFKTGLVYQDPVSKKTVIITLFT